MVCFARCILGVRLSIDSVTVNHTGLYSCDLTNLQNQIPAKITWFKLTVCENDDDKNLSEEYNLCYYLYKNNQNNYIRNAYSREDSESGQSIAMVLIWCFGGLALLAAAAYLIMMGVVYVFKHRNETELKYQLPLELALDE